MECVFDKTKACPITGVTLEERARFCHACVGRGQMRKAMDNMKVLRAQLILVLLRMFPKDEEKAKEEYQKLMKRVEEW